MVLTVREMIAQQDFDLVPLDIMMPEIDGIEPLKRIRVQKIGGGTSRHHGDGEIQKQQHRRCSRARRQRPSDQEGHRIRGPDAMEASGARLRAAIGIHSDCRGDRPYRSDRRIGASPGLLRCRKVAIGYFCVGQSLTAAVPQG